MPTAAAPALLATRLFARTWRPLARPAPRPRITRWLAVGVRAGHTAPLPQVPGRMVVHCRRGTAWITRDGESRDLVLRADESWEIDRQEGVTVHALHGDCTLELEVRED